MIEIEDLTKRYGAVTAVDGLSFSVQPGHVTGFLGPNGAGKSTTLRILVGLSRPTAGRVLVDGRSFAREPRGLRHVGALLDAGDIHGGRSAAAHLRALARSNDLPRRRVDEVLGEVGLADAAGRRAGGFSLGMRQRLGIATALLGDPPVLIFDEPFNGLDPEGVRWARTFFQRLAAEGRTVFVSSHLMGEMANTADELVVIGRGRLIAAEPVSAFEARSTGATVAVRARRANELTDVLTDAGGRVEVHDSDNLTVVGLPAGRVGELAFHHGIVLEQLVTQSQSLEDAFMELTADTVDYHAGGER